MVALPETPQAVPAGFSAPSNLLPPLEMEMASGTLTLPSSARLNKYFWKIVTQEWRSQKPDRARIRCQGPPSPSLSLALEIDFLSSVI